MSWDLLEFFKARSTSSIGFIVGCKVLREPRHGDIVIAGINGQKTVKRLFINGNSVRLMPENKNYQPIIVKSIDELSIWGVVTFVVSRPR